MSARTLKEAKKLLQEHRQEVERIMQEQDVEAIYEALADSKRLGTSLMETAKLRDYLVSRGQSSESKLVVWLDKLLDMMTKDNADN